MIARRDAALLGLVTTAALSIARPRASTMHDAPAWVRIGEGDFGRSVAAAGDPDADGFDDVLVGETSRVDGGKVYLYRGRQGGIGESPEIVLTGTAGVGVGDVDGDGRDDVLTLDEGGVARLYGGSSMAARNPVPIAEIAAVEAVPLGDVNGDALADFAIAQQPWGSGRVFVILGSAPPVQAAVFVGFGRPAAAGDPNRDGFDDVLVMENGRVSLYPGAPDGVSLAGWSMAATGGRGVGDVDGDGSDDVLLWHRQSDGAVMVTLYAGRSAHLEVIQRFVPRRFASVGFAVPVGDVDRDGHADLLVGGTRGFMQAHVALYRGGPAGFHETAAWTRSGVGRTAAGAGDVNADGASDILLGLYGRQFGFQGGAELYLGWSGDGG